jgi:hypothetical protein
LVPWKEVKRLEDKFEEYATVKGLNIVAMEL